MTWRHKRHHLRLLLGCALVAFACTSGSRARTRGGYVATPLMPPQVATPVRPTPPRIHVRVYGAMWQGALPSDETGPWQLSEAPTIVANLNAAMSEVPLTFELDQALPLPVQEGRFAMVAATRDEAALAFTHYAMAGRLSNDALAVVVVHPNPS